MAKLWTFGDSFTEGFNCKQEWCKDYVDWKGYIPKGYPEIISEKLQMKLMNFGRCAWDNYSIFESFCRVVDEIEKDDLVIFGWSDPVRFRLTDGKGNWNYFTPNHNKKSIPAEYMDIDSIDKLLANRANPRYSEEVNIWLNLINYALKGKSVIHWTPFVSNIQAHYLSGFEIIRDETNGVVNDRHFSETGQEELSKLLEAKYNKIKRKEII